MSSLNQIVAALGISVWLAGCGGSPQMPTAEVSGTVTYEGDPVTEGELHFTPESSETSEPGKPGAATIENGQFVVSTYGNEDGAVIGKHKVTYTPPPPRPPSQPADHTESGEPPVPSPYAGLVAEPATIDVTAEGNSVEIKLVKP